MLYCHNKLKGFTLSEMIIVMVVLGFVAMATVPMLGSKKIMNPKKTTAAHGVMECFYYNNQLYQYEANNTDNKKGKLQVVNNYCTFMPPQANYFVVTAIGAGGDGALSGTPYYHFQSYGRSGSISIGPSFATDLAAAPEWVRESWNLQWGPSARIPEYTIKSPVGAGGRGICLTPREPYRPDCDTCFVLNTASCPTDCFDIVEADGSDSGKGVKVKIAVKLGLDNNIRIISGADEAGVDFGTAIYRIPSSPDGNPATGEYDKAQNGAKVEDLNCGGLAHFGEESKWTCYQEFNVNRGGKGCTSLYTHAMGQGRDYGSVSYNGSIPYKEASPGIRAYVAFSGGAGGVVSEIHTSLPEKGLYLIPAKNKQSSAYSYVRRIEDGSDMIKASSGSNSSYTYQDFAISDNNYYPFPGGTSMFAENYPEKTPMVSASGFKSRLAQLAKSGYQPGVGGAGAFPVVTGISGNASFLLNNTPVYNTVVKAPKPKPADNPCDGKSVCLGSKGTPGAVVISW